MPEPLDELKAAIVAGKTLVICGAGVSRQATGDRAPGWKTLIESGLADASDRVSADTPWVKAAREFLKSKDPNDWLNAADIIQEKLGGPEGGLYKGFLRRQFSSLSASDPD